MTLKKRTKILNHCDRISFAGGNIYVFKYPKLKRTMKALIDASADIKEQTGLSLEEQESLAWKMVLENGIEGVSSTEPASMCVADYSNDEISQDEHSMDWDKAFDEVENGERLKQEKIQRERQQTHKAEIEREKKAAQDAMTEKMKSFEQERKAADLV